MWTFTLFLYLHSYLRDCHCTGVTTFSLLRWGEISGSNIRSTCGQFNLVNQGESPRVLGFVCWIQGLMFLQDKPDLMLARSTVSLNMKSWSECCIFLWQLCWLNSAPHIPKLHYFPNPITTDWFTHSYYKCCVLCKKKPHKDREPEMSWCFVRNSAKPSLRVRLLLEGLESTLYLAACYSTKWSISRLLQQPRACSDWLPVHPFMPHIAAVVGVGGLW